ncbi:DUF4124 domain-containing protein [Enterovibrio makurazakiensis]|uniref:DUF4124 domain-containing protein n=1 Tax=Enterovibrio gelatinilyticus TaxID=2899819 RepID=A0ABT5R5Y4_9GAMM|nr:DUF4124 domain-containing protein [Enterovibrio sp. ZSDZ42]MDD1795679.1 DUF4124 domain-containing protein [Enterovibrio sp. ZSDZ42]
MRRIWLMLLLGALSNTAHSDEYYRWVDENGTLHLSDSKPEFSVNVEVLIQPNTANTHSPETPPTPPTPPTPDAPAIASHIKLLSPINEATLRNNQGNINIELSTDLPLGKDQRVRAVIDGKPQKPQRNLQIELVNIDRGSHTIKVQLLQDGKVIADSSSVTVFLHRAIQQKAPSKGKPTPR